MFLRVVNSLEKDVMLIKSLQKVVLNFFLESFINHFVIMFMYFRIDLVKNMINFVKL